jgi:hypothetical protein
LFTENLVHPGLITDGLRPTGTPIWVAFRFSAALQHLLPQNPPVSRLKPRRSSFAIGRRGSFASRRISFRREISMRRRAVAAQTFKGGTLGVKAESCTVSARATSTRSARSAIAAVAAAAPVVSNRRRSMPNEKSGLAMEPSCETKGWRVRLIADFSATSPFPGDHRACGSRLVRAPALVFDAGGIMEQREKRSQAFPRSVPRVKSPEEAAPPRGLGRGCSYLAMFPTA